MADIGTGGLATAGPLLLCPEVETCEVTGSYDAEALEDLVPLSGSALRIPQLSDLIELSNPQGP
jgi:hypothetical protein